jgi:kumamolisin
MEASSPVPAGRVEVRGTRRQPPANSTLDGPVDLASRTSVTVMIRPRTPATGVAANLAQTAPSNRRYLTREEFAAQHGADPADVLAVEKFAIDAGLIVVQADLARRAVVLDGTVAELGKAFGATLVSYTIDGQTFRGRTGTMTVPAELGPIVHGVFGLDERPQARAQFRWAARPAATASTSYTPLQVAAAYDFPAGVNGTGQTIAFIELGGGYADSDLSTYFSGLGVPVPTVTAVSVDGATNTPTGNPDSADGEVALDIEVAGAIASGAKLVVYFAPNTDQGFLDAITTAVHDATNKPTIISISWGGPEASYTAQALSNFDAAFADAGTLGITVCIAAGDNGSSDGETDGLAHVDFPASSPHVLACGGTSLQARGSTITSETVWNDGAQGGATGGGISDAFALPTWQQHAGVPPSVNPGAHVGRGVPDVSGDADPETGYSTFVDGASGVVGGTSAVAPLWAALTALINQQANVQLGFYNPQLYALGKAPLNDITVGNNGAYSAGPGWDACTGLGSPNGTKLAQALATSAGTSTTGTVSGASATGGTAASVVSAQRFDSADSSAVRRPV